MRNIGGELCLKSEGSKILFTDSGRSSLRLFLRHIDKNKKILIPNFLCEVIIKVLEQENIKYEFYNILEDLSIDKRSVANKDFDIFYIINYFGVLLDTSEIELSDKIVVEDNVFLYDFQNTKGYKNWFAFNSFRKITAVADGSLIKTNLTIFSNTPPHITNEAEFVHLKYKAKNIKYNYLFYNIGDEYEYLEKFNKSENMLNNQTNIFAISDRSKYELLKIDIINSQKISKRYHELLFENFGEYCLNKNVSFYSFFVIKTDKRDELRAFLKEKNIFLPIHWPESIVKNNLYNNIISIPIFPTYSLSDVKHIIKTIMFFKIN